MCVLLYDQSFMQHAPSCVTDTILCHGGSLELVRIMNRVGAVASIDTASRLATSVVSTRISRGVKRERIPNTLSVVSIDNIDVLQVHAMVCSTDATLSWHGVSTQCVQPLPQSILLTEASKRRRSSPMQSPVVAIKPKRRCRSLTERSPHTETL